MVDIHSHILWGLDDGSRSIEQSLQMLSIAFESGVTDIVATPHSNSEYTFQPESMKLKIAELSASSVSIPVIHTGCDMHLNYENVESVMREHGNYTLGGGPYLLVECPDHRIGPETETVLERLLDKGLVPVVTHPERNLVLQNDFERLEAWVNSGCRMQITAMSITGGFGRNARSSALQLLNRGLAHFVASDAHDPVHRSPRLTEAFRRVVELHGKSAAQALFIANPLSALKGYPIDDSVAVDEGGCKWWCFWRS